MCFYCVLRARFYANNDGVNNVVSPTFNDTNNTPSIHYLRHYRQCNGDSDIHQHFVLFTTMSQISLNRAHSEACPASSGLTAKRLEPLIDLASVIGLILTSSKSTISFITPWRPNERPPTSELTAHLNDFVARHLAPAGLSLAVLRLSLDIEAFLLTYMYLRPNQGRN